MHSKEKDNLLASQRYNNLDLLKFICCFLVICIHIPFPGEVGRYIVAIARVAVPLFFMITGFFYSNTILHKNENKQLKKILKLVIISNALYFAWNLAISILNGTGIVSYIKSAFTWKALIDFVLLDVSPFSGHLWYLGALLLVLLIAKVFRKSNLEHYVFPIIPVLLAVDLVFGKYSLCIWGREFPVELLRNWLFVGLPYFLLGVLIKKKEAVIRSFFRGKQQWLLVVTILFILTTMLERYSLVELSLNSTRDHYLSSTFLAVSLFILCISSSDIDPNNLFANLGRHESTMIYIIHPAIITVVAIVEKYIGLQWGISVINPFLVFGISLLFAMLHSKIVSMLMKD